MRVIVDTDVPVGYETAETSDAKTEVTDLVSDMLAWWGHDMGVEESDTHDPITVADKIVESLIEMGWRPTEVIL